jgi:gliding motility-associated lipoprotein GldH
MRKLIIISVGGLFILMISSCGGDTKNPSKHTKTPYLDTNTSYNFPDNIWDSRDTICFKEYVDASNNYFINISLRNTTSYKYQNIIFFNHHYFNNNFIETDTIDILLAENDGRWMGRNISESNLKEILYTHNNKVSYEVGEHYFKLELAMRDNTSYQIDSLANIASFSISLIKEEDIILETLSNQLSLQEEYYIPKPKAKIKIKLPSEETSIYVDDIVEFSYSNDAVVEKNDNIYSIKYPSYNAEIVFSVALTSDFQRNQFFFQNQVNQHRKFGAIIDSSFLELPELDKYICDYDLYGSNIATSSMFYITDMSNYFVSGGLEFNTSINPEIEVQNNIMKQEILKFINSFKWSFIPK